MEGAGGAIDGSTGDHTWPREKCRRGTRSIACGGHISLYGSSLVSFISIQLLFLF